VKLGGDYHREAGWWQRQPLGRGFILKCIFMSTSEDLSGWGGRWDRCGGDLDWRNMWRKRNKEDKEGKQEEVKLDEEEK